MMVDRVFHGAAHLETLSRLLKWFHRDREEQFVFLVNAVLLVIHSDRVPPAPPGCTVIHSIDLVTILAAHRAAPRMELLSTVIDKHTHAGRQQGKNGFTFATEGAVVLPRGHRIFDSRMASPVCGAEACIRSETL